MIRTRGTRHENSAPALQEQARKIALVIAEQALRSMARGQWSYDFAQFRDVQVLAINILRLEQMMHPICEESFAQNCIALMTETAHSIIIASRAAAAMGQLRFAYAEDEILIDDQAEAILIPVTSILAVQI